MTTTPPSIVDEAESLIRRLADNLTRPKHGECLCCYLSRMLDEYSCDGTHRHAVGYRDAMAPRATALADRLSRLGACCCDCELFLNGYTQRRASNVDDDQWTDPPAVPLTPCVHVRRGSLQPCVNWTRVRRG